MTQTIIGLFDTSPPAEAIATRLIDSGFEPQNVAILIYDDQSNNIDWASNLIAGGLSQEEAENYARELEDGRTLLAVNAPDTKAQPVYELIQQSEALAISQIPKVLADLRTLSYPKGRKANKEAANRAAEVPQEEKVQRQANAPYNNSAIRSLDQPYIGAFEEGVWEIRTSGEEMIVTKQARVVEEVVINKSTQSRTETIQDTIRRTEVQVLSIRPTPTSPLHLINYATFDNDFRHHYEANLSHSGYTYKEYAPVYQYGYSLGTNPQYNGQNWNQLEAEAQQSWEKSNPGTWAHFKDTIRFAWDKARHY